MRVAVVAYEHPDPLGTAAGRALWAWCEGMLALGHDLDAWSWYPRPPVRELPSWCRWEPVRVGSLWRAHARGLVKPRWDAALGGFSPSEGVIAVADDVPSFAAVARANRSAVTIHYRALADARALRHLDAASVQTARAERRAAARASVVLGYSERVARFAGVGQFRGASRCVPIAHPIPERVVDPVDKPVAALVADWSWQPNVVALGRLLGLWPEVEDRVSGARLIVAGRNVERCEIGSVPGVEVIGEVRDSVEVLSRAAVVAFPCPPTSGPKVKVLEALAHGICVVTTPAGIEGLSVHVGEGAVVCGMATFAAGLARVLSDAQVRAGIAAAGRQAVAIHHSPEAAARSRSAAFEALQASIPGERQSG